MDAPVRGPAEYVLRVGGEGRLDRDARPVNVPAQRQGRLYPGEGVVQVDLVRRGDHDLPAVRAELEPSHLGGLAELVVKRLEGALSVVPRVVQADPVRREVRRKDLSLRIVADVRLAIFLERKRKRDQVSPIDQ